MIVSRIFICMVVAGLMLSPGARAQIPAPGPDCAPLVPAAVDGMETPEPVEAAAVPDVWIEPEQDVNLPVIELSEALYMAQKNSPQIRNLQETMVQADVLIQKARAILLPNLRAVGALTRNDTEIILDFPAGEDDNGEEKTAAVTMQEEWSQYYNASANITLFNARSIPLIRYARKNIEYSRLGSNHAMNEYLLAVTAAYYQVCASEELVEVSRENLRIAEEFLRLSKARKSVGQATRIDVLRAESQILDARNTVNNALDSVELARTALTTLIGGPAKFGVAKPTALAPAEGDADALIQRAFQKRHDLQAARLSIEMARHMEHDVMAQWLPAFDLTYNWNWNSSGGFSGTNDSWNVQIGASWSIFEGGSRAADMAQKKSERRIAENRLAQLERDMRREVTANYLEMKNRERKMALAAQQVEVARETHHLVTRQYEEGMATSLDVMDAYTQLIQHRISCVIEHLNYEIAVMSLNQSVGQYLVYPDPED